MKISDMDVAGTSREQLRQALLEQSKRLVLGDFAGYPAKPGTGPEGERCRTCAHRVRIEFNRAFYKCELARSSWTGSRKTDIKLASPACEKWQAEEKKDEVKNGSSEDGGVCAQLTG